MSCTPGRPSLARRPCAPTPPWRPRFTLAGALAAALLAASLTARAGTTRYADAVAGDDADDGLAATADGLHGPKATIQAAIDAAAAGDTVVALAGTYLETVRFRGFDLVLTSPDPADPATVAATVISGDPAVPWARVGVIFESGEGPGAVLTGLTVATGNGRGIDCRNGSAPTLDGLVLRDNAGSTQCVGGAIACTDSSPLLRNTLVWGNASTASCAGLSLVRSSPQVLNCTFAGNTGGGAADPAGGGVACLDSSPLLRHCILWDNTDSSRPDCPQVVCLGNGVPVISYSCVQGGRTLGAPGADWLPGSFDAEPLFAGAATGDFRLRSTAGHWTGSEWAADSVTSPCIDAGNPDEDPSAESAPNGGRLNLGFDGGTHFASRSPAARLALTAAPADVRVPEGGNAMLTVSLTQEPPAPIPVTAYLDPSVAGLAIASGATFILDATGWEPGHEVLLSATEDDADAADAEAGLWLEAQGLAPLRVPLVLADDDVALELAGGLPEGTSIHERGSVVAIAAQPPPHWHFVAWTGDTAGIADPASAVTTIRLDTPASITAQAAIDRHSLTLLSTLGNPQGAGDYDHGAIATWSVTSPVPEAPGQRFVARPASGTLVMDADRLLAVDWRVEHLLSASATGPGAVRPLGETWYRGGRTVTVTALPEEGCFFVGWQGDVPAARHLENPLPLSLDSPRAVQACFARTPAATWAIATVDSPVRPGADAAWVPVSPDAAGGWQSDLSIIVPPAAPPMPLAYCRASLHATPEETVGGDFQTDTPGRPPRAWQRYPLWPAEHCLVAAAEPPFGTHTQALRLAGVAAESQGLTAPGSALVGDTDLHLALLPPALPPPSAILAEFWHHRVGLRLRTDAEAQILIEIQNQGVTRSIEPNRPLLRGQWHTLNLFLWSRADTDGDGLDDGWERHYLDSLARSAGDDTDADGLDNRTEHGLGTDPTAADSDGDGMPDAWEYAATLDPLADDAADDADGDLLPNGLEAQLGTDPRRSDPPQALIAATFHLAAFWPFAESLGNLRPGSFLMTPVGDAAVSGGALALAGTGSVECRDLPTTVGAVPQRSLSVWFRAAGGGPLLAATAPDRALPAMAMSVTADGTFVASARGTDLDADAAAWTATAATDPAAWHHVALVCLGAGVPALYVDGEPVADSPRQGKAGVLATPEPWRDLLVGSAAQEGAPPTSFSGEVASLACFTDALSPVAVGQLFRAGRSLPLEALCSLDLDADGMPDAWEYAHFASLAQGAQDDADADGLADLLEYRLGTDPTSPDSDADALTDGDEVGTHRTNPTSPDTDADGLSDGEEVATGGSDPLLADTDGDGLPDGWERALGLSPRQADSDGDGTADAEADSDGDGTTNAEELDRGTDPAEPDLGPATVSFAEPSTPVAEAEASVPVTLVLSELPGGSGQVSLRVAVTGGTASPGSDYEFAETVVQFAPGALSATVEIRLHADVLPEPTETVTFGLTQVRGARLGTRQTHTIVIADALDPADDTDADGLPDAWEMRYFSNLAEDGAGDPDRDGLPNLDEFRCGSRPDRPYRSAAPDELRLRVTGLPR